LGAHAPYTFLNILAFFFVMEGGERYYECRAIFFIAISLLEGFLFWLSIP